MTTTATVGVTGASRVVCFYNGAPLSEGHWAQRMCIKFSHQAGLTECFLQMHSRFITPHAIESSTSWQESHTGIGSVHMRTLSSEAVWDY